MKGEEDSGALNAKTRRDRPGLLVDLLTDLIIRGGGKLLFQLYLWWKLFGWCGLGGFLGVESLDKVNCWGFEGCDGDFYFGYEL
jgi:hypothetical protein